MKRIFAILCLAALLFTGCDTAEPSTNTTAAIQTLVPSQTDGNQTVLFQQEIEQAWLAANQYELGDWYTESGGKAIDGVRHYGNYNGFDVIYLPTFDASITTRQIGNVVFKNPYTFELYVYNDGQFMDLQQAYNEGKLTEEALVKIALLHAQYQMNLVPDLDDKLLSDDVEAQMKAAFLSQYVKGSGYSEKDLTVVSYGEYDGAHVAFINGIFMYTQAFTTEQVGDFTFHYRTGQKLLVFYDGELMSLGEAYAKGILSDDALARLQKAYDWKIPGTSE